MKYFTFILLVLFFFFSTLSATIWVVDNTPGNPAANFTDLQEAIYAASGGDTIYVTGSTIAYGHITIDKKLYLFGPGYFLLQNDSTQVNKNPATVNVVTFPSEAAGSQFIGFSVANIMSVYSGCDSIVVARNYFYHSFHTSNPKIELGGCDGCVISQNFIQPAGRIAGVWLTGTCTNNIIKNNFISLYLKTDASIAVAQTCFNNIIQNNVLSGAFNVYNCEISNNILFDNSTYSGTGNMLMNNMCDGTQFEGVGQNNLTEVDMGTVFIGSGSTDGKWQLAANSPAAGSGTNSTDMGMFGGNEPYVLSGLPPLPTIFDFYGTNAGAQNFPVQLKIKARN